MGGPARRGRNSSGLLVPQTSGAALVRDLLAAGEHLLGAFAESATRLAGIDNSELREVIAAKLVRELEDRLVAGIDNSELREVIAAKLVRELEDRLVAGAGGAVSAPLDARAAGVDVVP